MPPSLDQQLSIYLTDVHAIELQALAQVTRAQKIAGHPEIEAAFADHVRETERHQRYVEDRLQAREWSPVPQKDLAGRVGGVGMVLFARFQPDTPGKLVAHAYAYERMEMAAYAILERLAERAGDGDTVLTARMIEQEERTMAERLEGLFDRAVEASLESGAAGTLDRQLNRYLADGHALEEQATQLLKKGRKLTEVQELGSAFEDHLAETCRHSETLEERLRARGESPSAIKDAALRLGALNLGMFFKAQVDTPIKLAGFAYAFEHLEVAAYELLKRVATRAGDEQTADVVTGIVVQERAAAARLRELFDPALDASLQLAGAEA